MIRWRIGLGTMFLALACRVERSVVTTGPAPNASPSPLMVGLIPASALTGTYTGDWGTMHLQVDGAEVRGAYSHSNGQLVARIEGDVVRGTWCQDSAAVSPPSGAVEFRFTRDADQSIHLDGRWTYTSAPDAWHDDWDLTRSTTPDAALAARVSSARCDTAPAAAAWTRRPDVASYWNVAEGATWGGLVRIERGITLEQAQQHAAADPQVTHFFFTTGGQMVLEAGREDRTFQHGDAAYFRGPSWWGSAPGLADGYERAGSR